MNTVLVALVALFTLATPQRPTKVIAAELKKLATELLVADPAAADIVVPPGGDLQAALNVGGIIRFSGTHVAPDRFVVNVSGTRLIGDTGAKLAGTREAIVVPPGVSDVGLWNFEATSAGTESVVRIGANDSTQTSQAQEPNGITLSSITVPTHRGKRGFEINARDVMVEDCNVFDTWSAAQVDSQGLAIANSSGDIAIRGGTYEAGSENIIVGGDWMKMVGVVPTNISVSFVHLRKPLSWRTDGVKRVVKNLFELKTGKNVLLTNSLLEGSWKDGQTGYAIVLTPTRDGQVTNVTIQDTTIRNVGAILQILGRAYAYYTPTRLGLTFQRNNVTADHVTFGGTGALANIEAEPDYIRVLDNTVSVSGSSFVTYRWGNVKLADGTVRPGGPMNEFTMTGNTGGVRQYGLNFLGYPNCGPAKQGFAAATVLNVTGNTFTGSAALMRTNFPGNTYP